MKNILYYTVMIVLTVFIIEISLNVFTFFVPNNPLVTISPIIDDNILGHRPNPKHPEHDENGFRNEEVPKIADVVAMGDSQTYGTGVVRNSAWPQQLQSSTQLKVYNMAYGGYGPVHSLELLDEALNLEPKVVIEAFYAGNDLFDSFKISYYLNDFNYLKTNDTQLIFSIKEYQKVKSLIQNISEVFNYSSGSTLRKIKYFLSEHIKLYRLLASVRNIVKKFSNKNSLWLIERKKSLNYPDATLILENDDFRTIFTPKYRLAAVNLDDPRILEGLNISLKAISLIKQRLDEQKIQFLVVLIPTKELVFSEVIIA